MRSVLGVALLLVACHPKPTAQREDAAPPPVTSIVTVIDAGPPPAEPEKKLTWGTRPNEKGPLFPVIDGLCESAAIRALPGKTIYTTGSTFARFEDDGIVVDEAYQKAKDKPEAWKITGFNHVSGTWPRLVLYSADSGGGRMRSYQSIWVHEAEGWSYRGSSDEKGEPSYAGPVEYKGWLISSRRPMDGNGEAARESALIQAWPMSEDAAPIPALSSLGRAGFNAASFEVAGESIYAFGYSEKDGHYVDVVRALKAGKVSEGAHPHTNRGIVASKDDSLFVLEDDSVIRRYDGVKATALPFKVKSGEIIVGTGIAPNSDIWALTSKNQVMVLHDDAVTTTTLPASNAKLQKKTMDPARGAWNGLLAGVNFDDPYAISDEGALFHFENGEWHEVLMPTPPFSTNTKYRADSVTMAAKGDLYVATEYYEKGIGWKTASAYRSILRTRRPKETLRCEEAALKPRIDREAYGAGFFSAPSVADDACATPLVILLRLGTKTKPNYLYDLGFPTLRAAIKETPGLGETAEILEIPWGSVQAIAMKAPDMATAKALAANAAKRVKNDFAETRPEIVCGVPPAIDKTLRVDVATGKWVTNDASDH